MSKIQAMLTDLGILCVLDFFRKYRSARSGTVPAKNISTSPCFASPKNKEIKRIIKKKKRKRFLRIFMNPLYSEEIDPNMHGFSKSSKIRSLWENYFVSQFPITGSSTRFRQINLFYLSPQRFIYFESRLLLCQI